MRLAFSLQAPQRMQWAVRQRHEAGNGTTSRTAGASTGVPGTTPGGIVYVDSSSLLPHPDRCDWFIECYNGVAYKKNCGDGLHFNARRRSCDFPHIAQCEYFLPDSAPVVTYI